MECCGAVCNGVITATPPLAVSVTETDRVVTTQVRVRPLGQPHTSHCSRDSIRSVIGLPPLAGLCQLPKHCRVAAAKRYIQRSNVGRNSGNSGRFLTSLSQNFDVFGTFCGRKYVHLDIIGNTWCASGCVVECRICNQEVAGSNLNPGYFAPRSTQPSIPLGSVNEYQLRLGRQRQVWLIPIADERVGVQVKL